LVSRCRSTFQAFRTRSRPKSTWQDTDAYERQARKLASMFADNFKTNFSGYVAANIEAAGPQAQ
jgi:phosphoenolpyruvate carboxykinase (ATP)